MSSSYFFRLSSVTPGKCSTAFTLVAKSSLYFAAFKRAWQYLLEAAIVTCFGIYPDPFLWYNILVR